MSNKFTPEGVEITPQGANYLDLDNAGNNITFAASNYVGATIDAKFAAMRALGFNAVRLHCNLPVASGASPNTMNIPYMHNIADAIKRAYAHHIYVVLSCGSLPTSYEPPFDPGYSVADQNWAFFSSSRIIKRNLFMSDCLNYIESQGVMPKMVLALEITGEIGLPNTYPLNQWPGVGTVVTRTGTYNRAVPGDKNRLIDDGIKDWMVQQCGICHFTDPAWRIMLQVNPETVHVDPTLIVPYTTIFNTAAESVGFSLYPYFDRTLATYISEMGGSFPLSTKICTVIETGWNVGHAGTLLSLASASRDWQAASCAYGIYGSLWFTWDSNHVPMPALYGVDYYNSTDNSSLFADLLNPAQLGDGCGGNLPFLAPIAATNKLKCKFYAPGKYALNNDSPIAVVDSVLSADIVIEQTNRFDSHAIKLAEINRDLLNALAPFTTVDFEQLGLGVIARGVLTKPKQQVDINHVGSISMEVPNITDQGLEVNTGMGYVDSDTIQAIVAKLGLLPTKQIDLLDYAHSYQGTGYDSNGYAVETHIGPRQTGWSATYLDDGTTLQTSQPINWIGLANCGNIGNTIIRNAGGPVVYNTSGGAGAPSHTDPAKPFQFQWQIVIPSTCQVGVRSDHVISTPLYGFDFSAPGVGPNSTLKGTWTALFNGAPLAVSGTYIVGGGSANTYIGNTTFAVGLVIKAGTAYIQYFVAGQQVGTDQALPAGVTSFNPVAFIATPGGEVDNLIMSHIVPASQAWFMVQYNKLPQTGALLQLAKDTGMFLRQGKTTLGVPTRSFEFGPMNKVASVTLTGPGEGSLSRLRANQNIRVVKEVTDYSSDVSGTFTVATPLGGGTAEAQIGIDLLWRILNDPTYQNFQNNFPGGYQAVFPEYDPSFTIWRDGTRGTKEYYIVYEPAFGGVSYAGWLRGADLPDGSFGYKEGGPTALSQFTYPDEATLADQEGTQRLLYKAYIELMKRAAVPHVTVSLTTIGDWLPPRAGDKVHIDYRQPTTDVQGGYSPLRIFTGGQPGFVNSFDLANPDPRVVKIVRKFIGDTDPEDDWIVSNLGKYEDTVDSQNSGMLTQVAAIQVSNQNKTNVTHLSPSFSEIDKDNPVKLPFFFVSTTFRVNAFYLYLTFEAFRQPIQNPNINNAAYFNDPNTPIIVTVGALDIPLPLSVDLVGTTNTIPATPKHYHNIAIIGGGGVHESLYIQSPTGGPGGSIIIASADNRQGFWRTNPEIVLDDPSNTGHTHPVASKDALIIHIPKTQGLAPLPQHYHPLPPGIFLLEVPTGLTIQIDSGNGVLIERTGQLVDALTGQGPGPSGFGSGVLLEMSRFVNQPNRVVKIQVSSTANASNGRGRIGWGGTITEEIGGLGSVVIAKQ